MPGKTPIRRRNSAPSKYRPWLGGSRARPGPPAPRWTVRLVDAFRPLRPHRAALSVLALVLLVYVPILAGDLTGRDWVGKLASTIVGYTVGLIIFALWEEEAQSARGPASGTRENVAATGTDV